jgi:hypothetical protein
MPADSAPCPSPIRFFMVSGHGIDDSLKESIRESSRVCFALPGTVKGALTTGCRRARPAEAPGLREPVTEYAARVQDLYPECWRCWPPRSGDYYRERRPRRRSGDPR